MSLNPFDASGPKAFVKGCFFIAGAMATVWFFDRFGERLGAPNRIGLYIGLIPGVVAAWLGGVIYDLFETLVWGLRYRSRNRGDNRRQ